MPPATEEEWRHRTDTREYAIYLGKDTLEYQRRLMNDRRGEGDEEAPRTPDARDRTLSRRKWKQEVQVWRAQLRKLFLSPDEVSVRLGPKEAFPMGLEVASEDE